MVIHSICNSRRHPEYDLSFFLFGTSIDSLSDSNLQEKRICTYFLNFQNSKTFYIYFLI